MYSIVLQTILKQILKCYYKKNRLRIYSSVSLSIYLFFYFFIFMTTHLWLMRGEVGKKPVTSHGWFLRHFVKLLSNLLYIFLTIYLSILMSIYLSLFLSMFLSIRTSIYLSFCLSSLIIIYSSLIQLMVCDLKIHMKKSAKIRRKI